MLADTLDVKLGAVRKLDAQYNVHTPQPMYRMAAMRMESDAGGAEQTYETGQIKYSASVSASFDIN